MAGNGIVLGFVGSPNKEGRTNQLITAALEGASQAGAATEMVYMGDYVVEACKDCLPWVCLENLKCTYEDDECVEMDPCLASPGKDNTCMGVAEERAWSSPIYVTPPGA